MEVPKSFYLHYG